MLHKAGETLLILFLSFFLHSCKTTDTLSADICILSGSEAGFTAAIQAARMGKKVVLIEPTGHPGGMLVEGLGKDIRFGSGAVIGGIAREFYVNVEAHYGQEPELDNPQWYAKYEPSVAEKTVEELLAKEEGVTIIRSTRIKEQNGVEMDGTDIKKVILENGAEIEAKIFIDASIEGHLLKLTGISYETIREGNAKYDETKNGIQTENLYRQFEVKVDPYIIPGDPSSGLIRTIQDQELGTYGASDKHIQGFCYRMCLTNRPENRLPVKKPENYDPADYEIYRRYMKAGGALFKPLANRHKQKTDIGSWHDLSANLYGENWPYPDGNYQTQDSIVNYHRDFTLGLIWFLQNDPEVDSLNRKNWAGWGLPKDEFADNGHWPRRLYIRSARRMVSDYIITQKLTERDNTDTIPDPVALAWWSPDMHHARRIVRDGYAYDEGFVFGGDDWKPFGVSWKALVPKRSECTNLISPTCPSSSYVAYGAIRIVPTFMVLGQSAGSAAAIAVEQGIAVQDVEYGTLRKVLAESGQILKIPDNWLALINSTN